MGFTAFAEANIGVLANTRMAQDHALAYFPNLARMSLDIGETRLELWGHNELKDCIHTMPDGSVLVLIGSPVGNVSWQPVTDSLLKATRPSEFSVPWDGRIILLKISADGKCWTIWNDWLGSIPIFHTRTRSGIRVASTLEPVVVAVGGFTSNDFFMPGLVSLLINGHFLSDWTLFHGMKTVLPDTVTQWTASGFYSNHLWTVVPSEARWETGWDDLVDEMHELSRRAIAQVMQTQNRWILPLSAGLDSRLIAAVGAELGIDLHAYAWGGAHSTDVVFSRQIAKTLGIPWKHINLPLDFLIKYTPRWANWFGSGLHFHGMYLMGFLDSLQAESECPVLSGFVGDVMAGDGLHDWAMLHSASKCYQLENDWYTFWSAESIPSLLKFPVGDAMEINANEFKRQLDSLPGAWHQKLIFLQIWNRQHLFSSFQAILSDYWRGVGTPFIDREYAKFCLSLPRAALDHRRLLKDVYRRYYGRLAVIPGTYADEPLIRTGSYLLKKRFAKLLHHSLQSHVLFSHSQVPLRMDMESLQASGKASLWPIYDTWDKLSEWVNVDQIEQAYQTIMLSTKDVRPHRQLQAIQTLAFRLL